MSPSELRGAGAGVMVETQRTVAHPWLCDINGHVNTRHYQAWFDDASFQLFGLCGFDAVRSRSDHLGIVDVKSTTEYLAEVPPGTLALISSGFVRLGSKSFTVRHVMSSVFSDDVFARCEAVSVFFDLSARRSRSIPDAFRLAAQALLIRSLPDAAAG